MYTITNNDHFGFIEVKIKGCWTLREFEQFASELRTTIIAFPNRGRQPATLYDFTEASIQPQDVIAGLIGLAASPALSRRRVAAYTEGVLARLQAHRIAQTRSNIRVFDSRGDAIDWVTSDAPDLPETIAPMRAVGR